MLNMSDLQFNSILERNLIFQTYAKPKTMMKLTQIQGLVRTPLLQSKTFQRTSQVEGIELESQS